MHNAMVEQQLPAEHPLPDLIKVDGRDRHPLHRAALFTGAIVFFVLGVVGWLLPVITGVPFYVVAILLLACPIAGASGCARCSCAARKRGRATDSDADQGA